MNMVLKKTKYKILRCKFTCASHKFYNNNNWAKDYLNIVLHIRKLYVIDLFK